jgi:hypothetical protein
LIWAFIADSTVSSINNISLDGYQRLTVFCSDVEIVKFDCKKLPNYCSLEFVQFDFKNADGLVISMAYHIGLSNAKTDKAIDFVIISSNDAFDSLCYTVRATGRNCIRKSTISEEIDLMTAAENIVTYLLMMFPDGRSRPRAASVLESRINLECQALIGHVEPAEIIRIFWNSGIIKENVNGINYQLSKPILT